MSNRAKLNRLRAAKNEYTNNKEMVLLKWGKKTRSRILTMYIKSMVEYTDDIELEATYDFIHFKMQNDGYSEKEFIEYLEQNKNILEVNSERLATILSMFKSKEEADKVFYKFPRILTRKIPLNKFFTAIQELNSEFEYEEIDEATKTEQRKEDKRTAPIDQMEVTYKFIIDKFLNDGFSEEQAHEFINQNLKLLSIPTSKIMSELAVLSIASLDDKVFYENTDLITNMPSTSRVYGAVKSLTDKCSVDDIREYLEKPIIETIEYDRKLTKERLTLIYHSYKRNFEKQIKEREQSQTL